MKASAGRGASVFHSDCCLADLTRRASAGNTLTADELGALVAAARAGMPVSAARRERDELIREYRETWLGAAPSTRAAALEFLHDARRYHGAGWRRHCVASACPAQGRDRDLWAIFKSCPLEVFPWSEKQVTRILQIFQ